MVEPRVHSESLRKRRMPVTVRASRCVVEMGGATTVGFKAHSTLDVHQGVSKTADLLSPRNFLHS